MIAAKYQINMRAEQDEALAMRIRQILESSDWEERLVIFIGIHAHQSREWRIIQNSVYRHLHGDNAVADAISRRKRIGEINPKLMMSRQAERNFAPLSQRQPSPTEFFKKHHGSGISHSRAVAELAKNYVIGGQLEYLIELDRNNPMMHAVIDRGMEAGFRHLLASKRRDSFVQKFSRLAKPGGMSGFLTRLPAKLVQRGQDLQSLPV
jgi:hypothetical protein